ncbi:hypothetical protein F5888DRAFT_1900627 [Russula emetica]|nr:hypothetical protein F5888DRAFT_1900627 [Russula emetica]
MNTPEQILHDRVNLVRLVRRLDKSINKSDWGYEKSMTLWLRAEGMLQQLKYARKLLSNVASYNDSQPSTKLRQRLTDIHGLLDKLDSFMLSVNERVIPEPPRAEPILPTLPLPPPSTRRVTPSVVQRLASPSDVTSEEESVRLPLEHTLDEGGAVSSILLPPRIPAPPLASAADAAPAQGLLQHGTALQEELSAQLAQMAGQLRRNAEHFSTALAADQAVLRSAEEKIGANYDVMKRERVRLRDHRGKSLGTTCLTITSVLVVTVAFLVMFFLLRFT